MCISPVLIPNVNYGKKPEGIYAVKDCTSRYIKVPCGHCDECIARKQMDLVQRVQLLSTDHYVFFATLTYNNECLPHVTTSSGFKIDYADTQDFVKVMKRIRFYNLFKYPFKYFVVSERGSNYGRPHFHCMFFFKKIDTWSNAELIDFEVYLRKTLLDNWTRNIGCDKKPIYLPMLTYKERFVGGILKRNYDLHLVTSDIRTPDSSVAWYCLKYMLKPDDRVVRLQRALKLNLPIEEYLEIWKKVKPKYSFSKNFASADTYIPYIKKGVDLALQSRNPFPYFISPEGSTFPLSRYFKSKGKFFSGEDALKFKGLSKNADQADNFIIDDEKHLSELLAHVNRKEKLSKLADIDYNL